MGTYTQLLYQIVFSTKNRERTLIKGGREKLFKYIAGIIRNKKSHLYRINGVEDHLHIVTHIHQSVSIADFVKDIKIATSIMIKSEDLFPGFTGWQVGYAVFSYSIGAKYNLIRYVKNQEEHHRRRTFRDELIELLNEHDIQFQEKYLE